MKKLILVILALVITLALVVGANAQGQEYELFAPVVGKVGPTPVDGPDRPTVEPGPTRPTVEPID